MARGDRGGAEAALCGGRGGCGKALGQLFLQPGNPGGEAGKGLVQPFIAEADQTQLRIGAPVGAAGQVGPGRLELGKHLQQPLGGQHLPQAAQGGLVVAAGHQSPAPLGGGLSQKQVPGQGGQLPQNRAHILAVGVEPGQGVQRPGGVPGGQTLHQGGGLHVPRQAQGVQNGLLVHRSLSPGALVQQGQGVPHAAVGQPGQQGGPLSGQRDILLPRHILQPLGDLHGQDALKGELLAPALDGGGHLVQLSGGQDEKEMGGGLLQNFQQGIEGGGRQHVYLVHDVHPPADGSGGIHRLVPQGAHLVHPVVGGGVQLQHVQNGAVFDTQTGGAGVAGIAVLGIFAVHRPGQNLGAGGLARPPGAGEQVGMGQPSRGHLTLQGVGNMGLTHHVVEGFGPPFSV